MSAPPGTYPPPVSGPPAAPVSAAPVSGSSVPPWGMVAPPWSSAAPSQPVDRPTDPEPEDDEPAPADAAGEPEQDAPEPNRQMTIYEDLLDFPESTRPEPPAQPDQGAWPATPPMFHQPPAAYPETEEPEPGRNRTVLALVVGGAVLAVVAAVGVGVVLLNREAAPPPAPVPASGAASPKVAGPPPGDLKLRDDTTTVTVTWTDPTNGGVPFVVAGGRAGQKLGVMATVDAGQTRYTVNGLSAKLDYCFTVLAVYSTDSYATSGQVCTDREGGGTPN
ncbi:fibronectin type III domain-containing protein [Micromonospora aurantiaca (nom. illeg.)]|uniref:fibronectin type III domain-containing protein n=1 Tax=Micromonospora aurantiaca (nom. illeg.) TaxID=47850 RepID=UPI0033E97B6D